jgi:hypothetical protein
MIPQFFIVLTEKQVGEISENRVNLAFIDSFFLINFSKMEKCEL